MVMASPQTFLLAFSQSTLFLSRSTRSFSPPLLARSLSSSTQIRSSLQPTSLPITKDRFFHPLLTPSQSTTTTTSTTAKQRTRLSYSSSTRLYGVADSSTDTATSNIESTSSHDGGGGGEEEEELMQALLYRVRECNRVPEHIRNSLLDFVVDGSILGKVTKQMADRLCNSSPSKPIFQISSDNLAYNQNFLTLTEAAGTTCQSRTDAVMSVMSKLRFEGHIKGWRDELLPLSEGFYDEPLLLVERAAAPFLGMQQYGVHINGIVRSSSSGSKEKMWMARRSPTKSKYPGMLDHIVAGGQPAGIGLMENVLKECMEEAGIPNDLTKMGISPAGAISYETYETDMDGNSDGNDDFGMITRSVLFCYDLELPMDFVPTVVDGEVEEFFLWSIEEVMESMKPDYHDPIKPNCYIVIIDYLLRAGHISPEIPGYLDVLRELRSGECR